MTEVLIEVIEPVCDDFVSRLLEKIFFLSPGLGATCQKAADARLFTEFSQIPSPFAIVKYGGEVGEEPENFGADPVIQIENMLIEVWCGAKSFSSAGEGTDNRNGRIGLNTIVDAVYYGLTGFFVPSLVRTAGCRAKAFHKYNTPPAIDDFRAISISTWGLKVIRQGGSA